MVRSFASLALMGICACAVDPGGLPADDAGATDCREDRGCDDSIVCTDDRCVDGSCTHVAVDSRCAGSEVCVAGVGCRPLEYRPIGRQTSTWVDDSGTHRVDVLGTDDVDGSPGPTEATFEDGVTDLGLFLATPHRLIGPVLELARPTKDDVIVDLGCGDGRVLIEAVRLHGCRARGVEIDPALAAAAKQNVESAGLSAAIDIIEGDAGDPSATEGATVVFAFLPPTVVRQILPSVMASLGPSGRFVTHEQLATSWPIEPSASALVIADGISVAYRWDAPSASGFDQSHRDRGE